MVYQWPEDDFWSRNFSPQLSSKINKLLCFHWPILEYYDVQLLLLLLLLSSLSSSSSFVTGLFFLVLLLNQRWSPPLRLQASHCSTFRIMCDVPSIAVFCSECIECFPGTASKFFLKLLVTIPVAPIITGINVHFKFHFRYISIHNSRILTSFPLPFTRHFCLRVLPHLSVYMFSLFCF